MLLGNRFVSNPANKDYLMSNIRAGSPGKPEDYYQLTYDYTYGSKAGLSHDYDFNLQGLLNTAYIKQTFGGAPFNTTDFGDSILKTGPGRIVDYGPRNEALTIVNSITNIQLNIGSSIEYKDKCVYPSKDGKVIRVSGLAAGLAGLASGGCYGPPKASLVSCTSNSTFFYPAQCVYDSATDTLTWEGSLGDNESVRFYFITYKVTEACGGSKTLTVSNVLYKRERDAPHNNHCIDVSDLYRWNNGNGNGNGNGGDH